MKTRTALLLCLLLAFVLTASAQKPPMFHFGNKYYKVAYNLSTLHQEDAPDLKSNLSVGAEVGRTFPFFGSKKICQFGFDISFLDVAYTNYKVGSAEFGLPDSYMIHQGRIGIPVGLSLKFNPIPLLNFGLYAHYAPTFEGFYADRNFKCGYAHTFIAGGKLTFTVIGFGLEYRRALSSVPPILPVLSTSIHEGRIDTQTSDMRVYVTLCF